MKDGYINTTNLVGVGMCNNPFYTMNGSKKIVAQNDPSRTAFANHAFCGIVINKDEYILDGCAGPHTGNEPRSRYLDASIDRAMGFDGNVSDIKVFNEVARIE